MIKAVIFDLDDTLVKTWQVKWAHHKAVAKRFYDLDLTDEVLAEHWGKPFDQMIGYLYQNADTVDNMRTANRSIEAEFLKQLQEGALELIAGLKSAGLQLAVLTSTNREFAVEDLRRTGFDLRDFFVVQGANETSFHKPDARVFKPILDQLSEDGIVPAEAVYVGDAVIDYIAARDAGMGFIAVVSGRTKLEDFQNTGAQTIAVSLPELQSILLSHLGQVSE